MKREEQITNEIWQLKPDSVIDLKQYLINYLKKEGKNDLEALEYLVPLLKRVKIKLYNRIEESITKQITPNFRFSDYSEDIIIGCNIFIKKEDLSQKLLFRDEIKKTINNLSWDLFENLCVYILNIYQFEKVSIGERTRDGGLDFFGYYIPKTNAEYMGFMSDLNLRIFGQSKHYDSKIGEPYLHEFHDLYIDFLNGEGRAYEYIVSKQEWFFDVRGPIVPFIITNNEFTSTAIKFADRQGIVIREGIQVVEDIITLSKEEPWFIKEDGKIKYLDDEFRKFFQN